MLIFLLDIMAYKIYICIFRTIKKSIIVISTVIHVLIYRKHYGQEAVYFLLVTLSMVSLFHNLDFYFKTSSHFILKLVNMFSLLNTDCRVPHFILIHFGTP